MGIIGVSIPLYNTPATVLLQQKVEPDYLGRVFGVLGMISSIMMPMGMLVFGPLADIIKIEWLLIVTGLAMVALSFFIYKNKELVAAGS
jgi:DHA3 family macrolide efflux protein-like MFS transporter